MTLARCSACGKAQEGIPGAVCQRCKRPALRMLRPDEQGAWRRSLGLPEADRLEHVEVSCGLEARAA